MNDHPGYNVSEVDEMLDGMVADVATPISNGRAAGVKVPERIPDGQRNTMLHQLGRSLHARQLSEMEILATLRATNQARCAPPLDDSEVQAIARTAATQPDRRDFTKRIATDAASSNGAGRSAVIIPASTITPEEIYWLWRGRIAMGALTNTVGLPDQGKTLVFIDITARLTIGSPMPPAPRRAGTAAGQPVLILTLEDSLSHTMVPRLIKAGANLELVDFVQMVRNPDGAMSLLTLAEDLDVLAVALEAKHYGLVVVDGITGYLGDAKTHNDADVRRVLAPFTALLGRAKVAGLSVMHPPKTITNLAYYAGGSVAFTAIPRVTLGVAKDPNDDSENPRRVLMKIKGNLYGPVPTLAYHIRAEGPAGVPWIEWEPEPVTVNIAEVLDPVKETPEDRSTRRSCEEWLRAHLANGPRSSRSVEEAAAAAGFTKSTLRRAREKTVDSVKHGLGGWDWVLR